MFQDTDAENGYPDHTEVLLGDLNYDFCCDLYLFLFSASWFKGDRYGS
ncbi:hypothetical protein D083_2808 [Dickeya solani RNS 08.23.3.1.A]|nr:hypothetical protein D083_2808 [Dickeya solani RNS 08.23.3.1.A]